MEPLLYLTHRIPFPPNKGDKVRSFNLLRFLAAHYAVHLGTFIDDPADLVHVPRLSEYCASSKIVRLRPARARIRSATAFLTGEALTVPYYRDAALASWVREVVARERIGKAVVLSSSMGQYLSGLGGLRVVVDFVDVDSAKWAQYGRSRRWPLSALFEREAQRLLGFERAVAGSTSASVFVTPNEAQLFRSLAPEHAARVHAVQNGVDTEFFNPWPQFPRPYAADVEAIVFTGAMDYWPNIDAVCWFAKEVLPRVRAERPRALFCIVGMQPAPIVRALAKDGLVVVTGRVPDVRPYLQHAHVAVAPLRLAQGIQNKVLEAMAMARPVVVSTAAAASLSAVPGIDVAVATEPADFARQTIELMDLRRGAKMGASARARVLSDYNWTGKLAPFKAFLDSAQCSPVTTALSREEALDGEAKSRFASHKVGATR